MDINNLCEGVCGLWGAPVVVDEGTLADFVAVVANRLPHGATSKLEAMGLGVTPPGWDPYVVMERVLGGEDHSWLCHAHASVTAALLRYQGVDAFVDLTHRRDPAAVPVDFHSVVRVLLGGQEFVCDPYHAAGPVLLTRGAVSGGVYGMCDTTGLHYVWHTMEKTRCRGLTYVHVASCVDDVMLRAVCDVSVGFSGVTGAHKAHVKTFGGVAGVVSADGVVWDLEVGEDAGVLKVVAVGMDRQSAFAALKEFR